MKLIQEPNDPSRTAGAARVWRLTYQFSAEVLTEAAPAIAAAGLDSKEFFVLDGIEDRPFPAALARYLSMPKPTVTAYLKSLQRKGLISREVDPEDLRRHRLILTTAGRSVVARARRALAARYDDRLRRLDAEERSRFERLLVKLTD